MLRVEIPRDIYQQGQTTMLHFVLSLLGAGIVVMVVAMLLLEKSVLFPLSRLSRSVSDIGESGDLSARLTVGGRDELSSLGSEINRMLGTMEKSNKALRESEEHYSALVGSLTDAVFKIKGRAIDWCNDRAEGIYGYRKDELVGRNPNILFPVDVNPPEFIGEVSAAIKERGYFHGTAKVKRKDGDIIYIEYSISKIPGREPMELVSVARDVTERKESEAKLNKTMAELARSNAELEQFAYVASHDLQEPLRMVASYTQLLARRYKDKLDADADEFIGYAVDGATRMQQLINDLLAYSRVGTRGKPFEPTDCEEVLNKALVNLQVAIAENSAVVTHDQMPTVKADATQMIQLFQNLIGNAVKFHGDNKPEVHVGAKRNCSDWIFSVKDNGIGIDPKYHERIFLIFQRLNGRKEYPGTGIGLTICRKIVDRHKGRIWVESQPGQGSTFYFTIPDGEGGKS